MLRLALLIFALLAGSSTAGLACGSSSPCRVKDGRYLVRPPAGWDGTSRLPMIVHFPGYQMTADDMMHDKDALAVFDRLGILVVAAEARGLVWNLPAFGEPRQRNEFAYISAVLDDVEKRFPIDTMRVLASGFSLGGSMVWYMACEGPRRFTAFAAFSGAFWVPEPKACRNGPVHLMHIHGLADDTVPVKGRFIRPGLHQGNAYSSLDTLRRINGCTIAAGRDERVPLSGGPEGVNCRIDTACGSGHNLKACFHDGGHYISGSWYQDAWDFLENALRSRSGGRPPDASGAAPG